MKTAFLLGGFNLNATAASEVFSPLRQGLEAKGYRVVAVDISWRRKLPTQYVAEFIHIYNMHKTEANIVIGNSFGAVIAFLSAPMLQPDSMYLCSLSPFFMEDKGKLPDSYGIRYFGKRRMKELWSYPADSVAKRIRNTETYVLYGELERKSSPALVARCIDTAQKIERAEIIEVKGASHDMSNAVYSKSVVDLVPSA